MTKEYRDLATQIVEEIGGKENISTVYHCQTRLRFTLVDNLKAATDDVKAIDGVTTVIINGGQYQVVIGTHVADVFEEVEKLVEISTNVPVTE